MSLRQDEDDRTVKVNVADESVQVDGALEGTETKDTASQTEKDPLIGRTIAQRYEILAVLGKGGMSTVYLARHLIIKNIVAVKVLHAHLTTNETTVKRFNQEAQAATKLDHPHIIRVLDCNALNDGRPYIVMEFVDGQSLSALIADTKPTLDESVDIFIQIAEALEHAHGHGIIHRDLKPSNIMIARGEHNNRIAKIVDFGIAKLLPQESEAYKGLTQTGETFGSPMYMSPEQCMAMALDVRTDIYSLGCLMYEVVAGEPPFSGGNVYDTIFKQLNDNPPPLSPFIEEKRRSEPLERVVLKCLAKEREQRYASVQELLKDLRLLESGHDKGAFTRVLNALELQRLRKTPEEKRNEVRFFRTVALMVLVAGGVITYFYSSWWLENKFHSEAVNKSRDEILWKSFYGDDYMGMRKEGKVDSDFFQEQHARALGEAIDQRLTKTPQEMFRLYANNAFMYMQQGSYVLASDYWTKAVRLFSQNDDFSMKERFGAYRGLALSQYCQGEWSSALPNLDAAVSELRYFGITVKNPGAGGPAGELLAQMCAARGDCLYFLSDAQAYERYLQAQPQKDPSSQKMGRLELALLNFQWALDIWETCRLNLGQDKGEQIALVYSKEGDIYRRLANASTSPKDKSEYYIRAQSCFEKALSEWGKSKGPDSLQAAICMNYLALIHSDQNRLDQADTEFGEAQRIIRARKGSEDIYLANVLGNYSVLLFKRSKLIESLSALQEAERIRHKMPIKDLRSSTKSGIANRS